MFNIHKMLPMLGFEPWTSVIRSDCSTNWATTTAHINYIYHIDEVYCKIWIFPHVWTARLRLGCDALSWTVWPDLAIYWTLDNFLKPLTTTILPKPPTFLGNFCKGVKIYNFLVKSFLLGIRWFFFWSHLLWNKNDCRQQRFL